MTARSLLYVPGDEPTKLARALERGADAVIIDLEDAVLPTSKSTGRSIVAEWVRRLGAAPPAEVWVRINAIDPRDLARAVEDVGAALAPGLTGLCVAKCNDALEVECVNEILTSAEEFAGLVPGPTRVSALIETARGLLNVAAIAAAPRIVRLQLGEADLACETGLDPESEETELLPARWQVVLASAAQGIEAPVGPASPDFVDLASFRRSTARLARLGFEGRAVIHPAQVPIVNEVFTPTQEAEAAARDLITQFELGAADGSGVGLDREGRMIDQAVVRAARRVVARAVAARSDGPNRGTSS